MTFVSPLFLLALLAVPLVLVFAIVVDRRRARFPVAYTNLDLLASVARKRRRPWRRWVPLAFLLLALACAASALARPRVHLSEPDQRATIVLLVDVSGSMRANDVEPTRLDAAVAAMRTFIDKLPSQVKVGLVAFSTEAQPLITPTTNRDLVRQAVGYLEPEAGTAIGDGLQTAVKMVETSLQKSGFVRKPGQPVPGAIVLLSDGAQNRGVLAPLQAAHNAKVAGIRVYPVSLGTPNGKVTFGFGAYTSSVPVPPDPVTMQQIAAATGGRAYTAQTATSAVDIYRTLGSSIGRVRKLVEVTSWFAVAAALLLLASVVSGRLLDGRIP